MDIKKIVSILNFLSQRVNYFTKLKAAKLLYFADKEHLIQYGRSITDDRYIKMKYGPVPTRILNIINYPDEYLMEPDNRKYLHTFLTFSEDKRRTINSKLDPDLDDLSKSEIRVLEHVIKQYGHFTASELIKISHKEFAYQNASDGDFLFVGDIVHGLKKEHREELLRFIAEQKREDFELHYMFN